MKIFLADEGWFKMWDERKIYNFNCLASFAYISNNEAKVICKYKDFILDSGAFTYMNNMKTDIDWDKYIEDYAKFINQYQVKHFIELDIDVVVDIKEVVITC